MSSFKRINVSVPTELFDVLQTICRQENTNRSHLISQLLVEAMANRRTGTHQSQTVVQVAAPPTPTLVENESEKRCCCPQCFATALQQNLSDGYSEILNSLRNPFANASAPGRLTQSAFAPKPARLQEEEIRNLFGQLAATLCEQLETGAQNSPPNSNKQNEKSSRKQRRQRSASSKSKDTALVMSANEAAAELVSAPSNSSRTTQNESTHKITITEHPDEVGLLSALIENEPHCAQHYLHRGNLYLFSKRYYQAADDYSRAIDLDPNFGLAYYKRSQAYDLIGHEQLAMQDRMHAKRLFTQS